LLVSWCAGDRCSMACSNEDRGRSWRLGVEDRGWSHKSGTRWPDDREVGWHRVRSALCMWRRGARVSWLSLKTKVDGLSMVWPQNYWDSLSVVWSQNRWDCFLQFGLKTVRTVSSGLALKLVAMVSPGLASKPVVGFLVEPQNEGGEGFSGLGLKSGSYGLVIWASKSL
jgi:hypothetical protein